MKKVIPTLILISVIFHSFCQEWYETDVLVASTGGAIDWFAYDTDMDNNFVVLGAPYHDVGSIEDQGAAFVYYFDGDNWAHEQILTASDGVSGDEFGRSVAIDGDFLVVGAMFKNSNDKAQTGAAYIFKFDGSTWVEYQKIVPAEGESYDWFGGAADIEDTVMVVGAHTANVQESSNAGTVHVYYFNGSTWYEDQELYASDHGTQNWFGISLDLNGKDLIIGSTGDDIELNDDQGSAYVFRYEDSWSEVQKLTASDGEESDDFGRSVSISGNTILIGSPECEIDNVNYQGAVYYFNYSSGNWSQIQKLSIPTVNSFLSFGIDLALKGDTAIIGAEGQTVGDNTYQGAAFIYTKNGSTWTKDQELSASDGKENDYYGNSVSITNNFALVGAYRSTIGSNSMQGSAYILKYGTNSINDYSLLANVFLYPNPTNGLVSIDSQQDLKLEVFNAKGVRIVTYDKVPSKINISNQSNGLYLFKFSNENGILIEKILLQK